MKDYIINLLNSIKIITLSSLFLLPHILTAQTSNQISQYGIVWTFDDSYEIGQFANGDYWVIGPVTISSISPGFNGSSNGWEVNPISNGQQGFDTDAGNFNASLVPSLPYTAQPGQSIVKTISSGSTFPSLTTAAVLTILAAAPPDGGASVFRPPYVGDDKPFYSVNDLHTELLPSLAPVADTPSLDWVRDRFSRVQLDHEQGSMGRRIRPNDNMPDYGADIGRDTGDAALRLMLDDPVSSKLQALIAYVQYGIDLYHAILNGQTWPGGGGYNPGRKLPLSFAAVLLDHQGMKNTVLEAEFFNEDIMIYYSDNAGRALFGSHNYSSEEVYWNYIRSGGTAREYADPYGYIDGGIPTDNYQYCCLSQPWKGAALAVDLMPQMKLLWNKPKFFDYVYRWVNIGTWTLPDPCAPIQGTYGVDYGPDGDGDCIKGSGRFPQNHGENADGGRHSSGFVRAMWNSYHNIIPEKQPDQVKGLRVTK